MISTPLQPSFLALNGALIGLTFQNDPKLVEKWDRNVWDPDVEALPENDDELIPEPTTSNLATVLPLNS